jgi:hypothetical protein
MVAVAGLPAVAGAVAPTAPAASQGSAVPDPLVSEAPAPPVDPATVQTPNPLGLPPEEAAKFVSPTATQQETTQVLGHHDQTPVNEQVDKRTAMSQTWLNADGSHTLKEYQEPKFFQAAGSKKWDPIDSALVPDEQHPGWFRNSANSWSVRFGPVTNDGTTATGGVVATASGQTMSFAPRGNAAGTIAPVVDVKAGTITYPSVWRNVDVRYKVTSTGVKEDLVITGPTDRNDFGFDSDGARLGADSDQKNPGGLISDGNGTFKIGAPSVADKDGNEISAAAKPKLDVAASVQSPRGSANAAGPAAQGLTLSVDQSWLKGLHANDFPVTVDPTVVFYANPWTAFASNGYSCSYPCLTRVGNSQYLGDLYWHTLAYFPYESLIDNGQKVVSANVNFSRTAGTSNGNPIYVCWAAAWSYDGACGTGLHGYWGSGTLNDTLDVDVTGLYAYWVDNSIRGGSLGITGNEQSGLFTYKELWDSVTVVYNTPPPVPTPTAPAVDAVVSTLTPTFAVNPV